MDHNEDMKIRARQVNKIGDFITRYLSNNTSVAFFSVEFAWNYPTAVGFSVGTLGDTTIKDICADLNKMAQEKQSAVKFSISDHFGDLYWDKDILLASWAPYYWEDENNGLHKLYDIEDVEKVKIDYDVCAVYPSDDIPKLGEDCHDTAVYTNGQW